MCPWAYEAHVAHEAQEAHVAYVAHVAHLAHPAHSEISMLDCPDDFHSVSGSYTAFEKNGLHRDRQTDQQTNRRTDTTSYRDARTHLKMRISTGTLELKTPLLAQG